MGIYTKPPAGETSYTTNQHLPLPNNDAGKLNSVPDYMNELALAIEKQIVMRFQDDNDFTSKVASPQDGMLYWLIGAKQLYIRLGGAGVRIWPPKPVITVKSGAPTSATAGEVGDLYFELDA